LNHPSLSDKGLAVFAFAIYHQLESGSRVTQVVTDDGAGHHADDEAIRELQALGLVTIDDGRVGFTERGEGLLDRIAAEMRRAASDNPEP
jgi:ribosomal protein S19E (S16A)